MKLSKTLTTVVGAVAIATSLAACSGEPLSTREKGTLIGTGVGAAGGAVVGAAVGAPLAGAAIGGVALVGRQDAAFCVYFAHCSIKTRRLGAEAEVVEHQGGRHHRG